MLGGEDFFNFVGECFVVGEEDVFGELLCDGVVVLDNVFLSDIYE